MNIQEILGTKENVLVVVNLNDLKEMYNTLLDEREAERMSESDNQRKNELVSADETAKVLGVKRNTLWRWARDGYLTPVKIGRKRFYKQADIDSLKSTNNHR